MSRVPTLRMEESMLNINKWRTHTFLLGTTPVRSGGVFQGRFGGMERYLVTSTNIKSGKRYRKDKV